MSSRSARVQAAMALTRRANRLSETNLAYRPDASMAERYGQAGDHRMAAHLHRTHAMALNRQLQTDADDQKEDKDAEIVAGFPTPYPLVRTTGGRRGVLTAIQAHDLAAEAHEQLHRESLGNNG